MTYRFSAVITQEDELHVARCPELGVTSQGADLQSALANLREAIELYLETWGDDVKLSEQEPYLTVLEIAR